ncbi:MAG: hypothetical protein ABFD69_09025 [Candidatus Sumerlaeia bacterium]
MGKPVIRPSDQPADWIEAIEQRAGLVFPNPYYLFATRFGFSEFELGGITFFAAASDQTFKDPVLSAVCLKNGYLQFGNPETSPSYDPICFYTKFRKSRKDCPIVQLDHEKILIHERIEVVKVIAPTMRLFMESVIESV